MQYFVIKVKIPLGGDKAVDADFARTLGENLKQSAALLGGDVETSVISDTPQPTTEVPELETGNSAQ